MRFNSLTSIILFIKKVLTLLSIKSIASKTFPSWLFEMEIGLIEYVLGSSYPIFRYSIFISVSKCIERLSSNSIFDFSSNYISRIFTKLL